MPKKKTKARSSARPRKKTAKSKARSQKKLRKAAAADYEISWSPKLTSAKLKHKSGKGGTIGAGATDIVYVYTNKDVVCAVSVNYFENYCCIECFDDQKKPKSIVFMNENDIKKSFKKPLYKVSPAQIASKLYSHC